MNEQERIVSALRRYGASSPEDISKQTGVGLVHVVHALGRMRTNGRIVMLPDGGYGLKGQNGNCREKLGAEL